MMQKKLLSVLLLASGLSACEPGQVTLVEPERAAEGETVIEARVVLADSAMAAALGWSVGVPGATGEWAHVQRWRYLFRDVQSDSAGLLRIEREGPGMHWIAAEKAVEIDGVPRVLGGGLQTRESGNLSLNLDDPGSLVISEVHMTQPPPWETGGLGYNGSKYIELYNNSVVTLYLDGVVLGVAYSLSRDFSRSGHHPCSYTKPFREDADAVWSQFHWQFPGTGADYPLRPGAAVVVAVSAADHTAVHPSMLDMSHANFEFGLEGAADNPAAPNMVFVGTAEPRRPPFLLNDALWFVSAPVELDMLPMMVDDDWLFGEAPHYRGFPADAIYDVAVIWWDATSAAVLDRDNPPCDHPIHPIFDAMPGGYLYGEARPEDLLVSPQRRVVRINGGQSVLLDTNTSAVDFENMARTPGWIPSTSASVRIDGRR